MKLNISRGIERPKFASRPPPESLPGRHFSVSEEDGEIRTTMERPKAEAAATAMQPYELSYSDLLLLSSPRRHPSPPSEAELRRLDSIRGSVMEALGPAGPGLLCVRDVPEAPALRRELLPLARRLALLVPERRRRILQVFSPMIALLLFSRICTWAAVIGDHLVPIPQYVFDEEIGKVWPQMVVCRLEIGLLVSYHLMPCAQYTHDLSGFGI